MAMTPSQTRKSGLRITSASGNIDFEADADEFRRIISVSAVLAALLPNMPEKYLVMESFRKHFKRRIGYAIYYIDNTLMLLAACDIISITEVKSEITQRTMKQIRATTDNYPHLGMSGNDVINKRLDWVLGLDDNKLRFFSEGGANTSARFVLNRLQQWYEGIEKNNLWEKEIKHLMRRGSEDD